MGDFPWEGFKSQGGNKECQCSGDARRVTCCRVLPLHFRFDGDFVTPTYTHSKIGKVIMLKYMQCKKNNQNSFKSNCCNVNPVNSIPIDYHNKVDVSHRKEIATQQK